MGVKFLSVFILLFFSSFNLLGASGLKRMASFSSLESVSSGSSSSLGGLSLQEKAQFFLTQISTGSLEINQGPTLRINNTPTGLNRTDIIENYAGETLDLVPGTVYYYQGASQIGFARHYGIYLGFGWIIEKNLTENKGTIVIKRVEDFRSPAEGVRRLRYFMRLKENNTRELRPSVVERWSKEELIKLLEDVQDPEKLESLSHYRLLYANCYHFVRYKKTARSPLAFVAAYVY